MAFSSLCLHFPTLCCPSVILHSPLYRLTIPRRVLLVVCIYAVIENLLGVGIGLSLTGTPRLGLTIMCGIAVGICTLMIWLLTRPVQSAFCCALINFLLHIEPLLCLIGPIIGQYLLGTRADVILFGLFGPFLAALVDFPLKVTWGLQLTYVVFSVMFAVADGLSWDWFYAFDHVLPWWFTLVDRLNCRVLAPCAIVACVSVFHYRSRQYNTEMERLVDEACRLAQLIGDMDLDTAQRICGEGTELELAFQRIISNLKIYRPFIPDSIFASAPIRPDPHPHSYSGSSNILEQVSSEVMLLPPLSESASSILPTSKPVLSTATSATALASALPPHCVSDPEFRLHSSNPPSSSEHGTRTTTDTLCVSHTASSSLSPEHPPRSLSSFSGTPSSHPAGHSHGVRNPKIRRNVSLNLSADPTTTAGGRSASSITFHRSFTATSTSRLDRVLEQVAAPMRKTVVTFLSCSMVSKHGRYRHVSKESVAAVCDTFLERALPSISSRKGNVHYFGADWILASFSTADESNHTQRACEAAVEIKSSFAGLLADSNFKVHIGLWMDTIMIGTVGTSQQKTLGLIGSAVRHCHCLEHLNEPWGTSILVRQRIATAVSNEFDCRPIDHLQLLGEAHNRPELVYELIGAVTTPRNEEWMYSLNDPSLRSSDTELKDAYETLHSSPISDALPIFQSLLRGLGRSADVHLIKLCDLLQWTHRQGRTHYVRCETPPFALFEEIESAITQHYPRHGTTSSMVSSGSAMPRKSAEVFLATGFPVPRLDSSGEDEKPEKPPGLGVIESPGSVSGAARAEIAAEHQLTGPISSMSPPPVQPRLDEEASSGSS